MMLIIINTQVYLYEFCDFNIVFSKIKKPYFHGFLLHLVERTGLEPVTSSLPAIRAPNCANAPCPY